VHEREHTQGEAAEAEAEVEIGSGLSREPSMGLDPWILGS